MKEFENGLNRDGSFRARRVGIQSFTLSDIYSRLISMSWANFFVFILLFYFLLALAFALAYLNIDPEHVEGLVSDSRVGKFWELLLFSTQILSTIGGENIVLVGLSNNIVYTLESMTTLFYVAIITGLLFVRFSHSSAKLIFSDNLLISPYKDGKGLMLRIANAKRIDVLELRAHLFIIFYDPVSNKRNFQLLNLEQHYLPFNSTSWTIVHPIVEGSPLYNVSIGELQKKGNVNFIIYIGAVDSITGQNISARQAYAASDIITNAKFLPCSELDDNGEILIYLDKIGSYEVLS
jgi:inward rectifier potassium channel